MDFEEYCHKYNLYPIAIKDNPITLVYPTDVQYWRHKGKDYTSARIEAQRIQGLKHSFENQKKLVERFGSKPCQCKPKQPKIELNKIPAEPIVHEISCAPLKLVYTSYDKLTYKNVRYKFTCIFKDTEPNNIHFSKCPKPYCVIIAGDQYADITPYHYMYWINLGCKRVQIPEIIEYYRIWLKEHNKNELILKNK